VSLKCGIPSSPKAVELCNSWGKLWDRRII